MGDENPIRTLGDYSKPSHEGYRNTIELPVGKNVLSIGLNVFQQDLSPHGRILLLVSLLNSFHREGPQNSAMISRCPNNIMENLYRSMDSFKTYYKSPSYGIHVILCFKVQIFYDHVNPVTRRTIDQSAGAHLALTQPTQVNKITTSCEICSGPYDTQYCMEDPEQAFVEYASSRTDEAGRLSKFEADFKQQQSEMTNKIDTVLKAITDRIAEALPSDAAHFKEATISQTSLWRPKIEIEQQPEEPEPTLEDEFQDLHLNLPNLEVLAHTPIYNTILDKYVESLKLGKNGSAFVQGEIPAKMEDPGLFTLPCWLGDSKPFDTLADLGSCVNIILLYLFKKLNIRLLEETNHVFGLADRTKSYPVGIVKDVEVHIGKLKLLNDFYVIDMKKDIETLLLVGRGFLATANAVIDCEEEAPYWTTLGKRESYKPRPYLDGIGARTPYYARKDFLDCHLLREWEIARDAELNPFKDTLVFRRMVEFLGAIPINLKSNMWESEDLIKKPINWDKPPKNGDGAWHTKIRLIDLDEEEFTKTLQSIPTSRKLSERESPREIIELDHFYDT
ncbi:MAK10-like protein [Tanacetum coccineum]|uniref:MAK10-like protein n=1 Tax=Tanacetum coccineum TaxID=301880 RepID=A0ABQ5A2T5_9ASTR